MSSKLSPAMRRYLTRLSVLVTIYVGLIFLAGYIFRHNPPQGGISYVLAILPALPVIGVFWAVMRLLVEETDEYIRMLLVWESLFATGFCLTIVTIWQSLQNYDLVPQGTGGFGAAFFWFMGLGVAAIVNRLVLGRGRCV